MSGTASVPNTFQSQSGNIPLSQLDANFSTIVAYINDPTNRNNYGADTGGTNTVALSFSPAVLGYTAGVELNWKWAATNSGAVVINANGLGNINVVNPDGSALQVGQGQAGSIGKAIYDGTRAIYISASAKRPQDAKAWGYATQTSGTYTLVSGYNVASLGRAGVGTLTVVLTTAFTSTAYVVTAQLSGVSGFIRSDSRATGAFLVRMVNAANNADLDSDFNFVVYGNV